MRLKSLRNTPKTAVFLFLLIAAQACSIISDSANEKIVILTPHHTDILDEFKNAFKKNYMDRTGKAIEVEFLDLGGTSNDLKYIISEFSYKPKGIGIDVFWGGGVIPYRILKDRGLLESYNPGPHILSGLSGKLGQMPFYDPEYKWFGSALSVFGIICNKKLLQINKLPMPGTWKDLAKQEYKGSLGAVDPRNSGVAHTIFASILQAYGWENGWKIIFGIAKNTKKFVNESIMITKEITSGEIACGPVIDFYAWLTISEFGNNNIGFIIPKDAPVFNFDAIALLKGASNKKNALEFMSFVLSEKGQALWLLPAGHVQGPRKKTLGRMPVIPALYDRYKAESVLNINPFKVKNILNYDDTEAEAMWSLLNDMIGTFVIDRRASAVPIDKKTAVEYSKKWNDEIFRNKIMNDWLKL